MFRMLAVEHPSIGEHQPIGWHGETRTDRGRQDVSRAFGRLNRRVAHHQRDAARVGTEIDRVRSVSPVTARTSNGSMPSTSAINATSTSSEPWPISVAPQNAVTPPLRSSFS
jgi:hypothetical protein